MSSAEAQTKTALAAKASLAALVSTRIFADKAPQGASSPFVVFVRSSSAPEYTLYQLAFTRVIMLCISVAATRASAVAINTEVIAAMADGGFIVSGIESDYVEESDQYIMTSSFEVIE